MLKYVKHCDTKSGPHFLENRGIITNIAGILHTPTKSEIEQVAFPLHSRRLYNTYCFATMEKIVAV